MGAIKNKPKKESNTPELNERLKTISKEYEDVSHTYQLTPEDVRELLFEKYKAKFPETYQYKVQRLIRVQIPNTSENALMYYIAEQIQDNKFQYHKLNRRVGFHAKPLGTPTLSEYGEITDMDINNWEPIFDVPFNPSMIRKLVDGSTTRIAHEMSCGRAAVAGQHPLAESARSVFNFSEFLESRWDDLWHASALGYLKNDDNGVKEYLAVRSANLGHGVAINRQGMA